MNAFSCPVLDNVIVNKYRDERTRKHGYINVEKYHVVVESCVRVSQRGLLADVVLYCGLQNDLPASTARRSLPRQTAYELHAGFRNARQIRRAAPDLMGVFKGSGLLRTFEGSRVSVRNPRRPWWPSSYGTNDLFLMSARSFGTTGPRVRLGLVHQVNNVILIASRQMWYLEPRDMYI